MFLLASSYQMWSCIFLPSVQEAMRRIKVQGLLNLTLINTRICFDLREPLVLIVIRSRPDRQDRRKAIRDTWANPCTYDPNKVRYLFLTGKQPGPQSVYVDEVLQREFDCYGDIVQYDSLDGYHLLPKKQFIALSLVHHLCSNFPFVFMTDEDFLINIPKLTEYLLQVPSENRKYFVGGHLYKNVHPTRDKGSKYYVEYDVYPNKTYPPFVAGGASFISTSLIQSILAEMSTLLTEIHLEDVRMGIVLQRLDIVSIDVNGICIWPVECRLIHLNNLIAKHGYNDEKSLYRDWKKLNLSLNYHVHC
ncbi:hypothetical protein PHET_06005 [Paragonimus heterotremus]|uniref:Hexosyltransferase n=1 Tax=Paragonimus heterotremus TaxID=100268 RepID=A0A8J4WZ81_9TREM|nr:hypothetical protein PHET_06005 [Paragonimus heterotremus]